MGNSKSNRRTNKHSRRSSKNKRHRPSTAGPGALRVNPAYDLPPTPQRLASKPLATTLAGDGCATVPVFTDGPCSGWAVVDADGRQTEMLMVLSEVPSRSDLRELAMFERYRSELGDPMFSGYDPGLRAAQAAEAPDTPDRILHIAYRYGTTLADGSCRVLVVMQGVTLAWLVLDAEGNLADGARILCENDVNRVRKARWEAFTLRRIAAGDPVGKAKHHERKSGEAV